MAYNKKNRMTYVPIDVLNLVDGIMKREQLKVRSEGFRKLAQYATRGEKSKEKKDNQLFPGDFFNE